MTTATAKDAAAIIGVVGDIVGKTKLQKTVAILELAGLGPGFSFSYYLYGPYSDDLSSAVERGVLLGLIREEEKVATWGGRYSVFHAEAVKPVDPVAAELIRRASRANSIVLELAVTAAFLASRKENDPWERLCELKPEKTTSENIAKAKLLYSQFREVATPARLPAL